MSKSSIVFFGTGQTSLEALIELEKNFIIEAVVTKPAPRTSNGSSRPTEVERWAKTMGLKVFNPAGKQDLTELIRSQKFSSSVGVVLDYSLIIPKDVIESFSLGILNSHFSLLPRYRGADPIRSTILNGDDETGVTIIKIVSDLDAGPILSWAEYSLKNEITAPELRSELSELNARLLNETLKLYLAGDVDPIAQDDSRATYTTKTSKQDGLIDSTKPAKQIEREVRAFKIWPKSYFYFNDLLIFVSKATVSDKKFPTGELSIDEKNLYYGTASGSLQLEILQLSGKAEMTAANFINGYKKMIV